MQIYIDDDFKDRINGATVRELFDEAFYINPTLSNTGLKGVRGAVLRKNIAGLSLVIRLYRRGGWARYLFRDRFFRNPFAGSGQFRPFREFFILKRLSSFPVPIPVAAAVEFGPCTYSGIIITKEISRAHTLLAEPPRKKELAKLCVSKAGELARDIIENGVYHPDLHLGNVMYQEDGSVYLIDFDGAQILSTEYQKQRARAKTAKRWIRSVHKWMGTDPGIIANFQEPFLIALNEPAR